MSEGAAPTAQADALQRLATLRGDGAWRFAPARLAYLETLAQRLQEQPSAVRALLQDKLQAALDADAAHFAQTRQAVAEEAARLLAAHPTRARELRRLQAAGDLAGLRRVAVRAEAGAGCAPLALLNASLRSAVPVDEGDELASVRRFRQAWGSGRSQDQVAQAQARGPANAGPLNSHALVLQSLDLMGTLSPDYLRRFLVHLETLQWLDEAADRRVPAPAKSARQGKAAAPARRRATKR